uniref:Uncharacterized protein n=1 Tax=Timema monikensis TaxID=170555 RepID=A0A7R9HSF0_9NEOP|nr:unnamed protein product [Timema monikensis]
MRPVKRNAKYKILKKETQRLAEAIKALEKKVKEKDKELSRLRYQLSCHTSGTPTNSRPPSAGSHPSPYFPTPSSQGSPVMGPPNRPTPGRSSHNFNELYQSKLITPNRLTLPRRMSPVSNNSSQYSQYSISPGNSMPSSINGSPVQSFNNKIYRSRQVSSPGTPLTPRSSQLLSPESPAYNKYCSIPLDLTLERFLCEPDAQLIAPPTFDDSVNAVLYTVGVCELGFFFRVK